ncbi:MAG: histidine kinase N-terminal 7TM domain-containing protein [Candidatus Saccharibacteria bacterium]|nr:histidine kinase N-terminal 7TM domain-containing protein [Candidatus Saccharibacteria bacterium]
MQLITILLALTAILTFASGIAAWAGSKKTDKKASKYFAISMTFGAIWTLAIMMFVALKPEDTALAPIAIFGIYIPAMFMDICLMVYCGYPFKLVRGFGVIMAMFAALMSGLLIYDPSILYSSFTLSHEGNSVALNLNWFYMVYAIFYFIITGVIMLSLFLRIRKTRNKNVRAGLITLGLGILITGTFMLTFDVVLPIWNYGLIWIGVMTFTITMVGHYYSVLKYRLIQLSGRWLKALSYAIILITAGAIYMLLFYIIFTALFKVSSPSPAIFVLNFLMIAIVLLLLPAMNELSSFVRSLISSERIDIAYVTKKLNIMSASKVNMNELSGFLADHLHFSYVGILIKGKLYGSEAKQLSTEELKAISNLPEPKRGIWQQFNKTVAGIMAKNEIKAVAILVDSKGKQIGQLILGRPEAKNGLERRELIQLEMLINLTAATIDRKK